MMLDTPPPLEFKDVKSTSELDDAQWEVLKTHAVYHYKLIWSTGISIIEAAESIVDDALSNANIETK
jgi:hypothetical protein